ncbi:hypothetical protein Sta7437_0204 [Stanieria cyanosphaera PCC 7437]|uniref:Uncharacterized protein n=1 Tax=Stanieria cyanosphaera (strain ATCC 29371 / PCC 7437) TaxID=111780 RepID=K9XQ77_STAC7|nr:hypothetical protein [Stanieria cyanosphaera]AFZ33822.1 hypothetical protein Sta7437_0204 [Stanieria cyanosphaera PCC 7437]
MNRDKEILLDLIEACNLILLFSNNKEVDLKILWEVIQTSIPQLLAQALAAFESE